MADDDRRNETKQARSILRARRSAYLSMLVERVWPIVLGFGCLIALFLILSWFGIFAALAAILRLAIIVAFGIAALAGLWFSRNLRLPSRAEVDDRVEGESRLSHQPLRIQNDQATSDDPMALALWREHQRRMAERLRHLRGGTPNTRTERLDPYGLRAGVALLLVTAFAYSFGPGGGRVADALTQDPAQTAAGSRVDAWVTPPSYTGRAPLFLTGELAAGGTLTVPQGSVFTVRLSDGSQGALSFVPVGGSAEPVKVEAKVAEDTSSRGAAADDQSGTPGSTAASTTGPREFDLTLETSGEALLETGLSTLGQWRFTVTPDTAPQIAFKGEPQEARNGALQLIYSVTDDYGVARAEAELQVKDDVVAANARPLIEAPTIRLTIPRRTKGTAEGRSSTDLTESPYAGAVVALTLVATDDAGQVGRSSSKTLKLPEKRFSNPLARAVVEQRRMLALDANAVDRVVEMLDAITLHGDAFIDDPSDYLALKAVRTRIAIAHDDEALISAVNFMWQIALGIEDGNLSLAERRLRDAREQLSQALENGASNEEIDKLMQELRQAMNDYMQALAQQMQKQPMDQNQLGQAQELRPQDLDRMLDRIEDLAKSGSKEAAQQLLSQMQQMMDNLQAMRPGQQQQSGEQNAMQQEMNKMGDLLQRQQELMDQTFALGRRQMQQRDQERRGQEGDQQQQQQAPGQNGEPMTAEQLEQMMKQLQSQQGQLQKQLGEMQQRLQGMGMKPADGFDDAGKAMGRAEGALGEGNDGEAVGQQGQALEALRQGAQNMMQQMQQAMQQGQGQQPGPGQTGPGFGRGQQQSGRDPLGRQRQTQGPDFGQDVGVPDEIDTQRAREILDEIRNRLGNNLSPQLERQYLERLLQTP